MASSVTSGREREYRGDTDGDGRVDELEVIEKHSEITPNTPDENHSEGETVDSNNSERYSDDNSGAVENEQQNAVNSDFEITPVVDDNYIGTTDLLTQSFDSRFGTLHSAHELLKQDFENFKVEMAKVMAKINFIESSVEAVSEPMQAMKNPHRNDILTNSLNRLI